MGLDGISINQLRATPEMNSAELNSAAPLSDSNIKAVDGLSQGQRVDPDKENSEGSAYEDFSSSDSENEEEETEEIVTKYDLSDANKYIIKLDDETNHILIVEKSSGDVIQVVSADMLSHLVSNSSNSCGVIINKKF